MFLQDLHGNITCPLLRVRTTNQGPPNSSDFQIQHSTNSDYPYQQYNSRFECQPISSSDQPQIYGSNYQAQPFGHNYYNYQNQPFGSKCQDQPFGSNSHNYRNQPFGNNCQDQPFGSNDHNYQNQPFGSKCQDQPFGSNYHNYQNQPFGGNYQCQRYGSNDQFQPYHSCYQPQHYIICYHCQQKLFRSGSQSITSTLLNSQTDKGTADRSTVQYSGYNSNISRQAGTFDSTTCTSSQSGSSTYHIRPTVKESLPHVDSLLKNNEFKKSSKVSNYAACSQ